MSSELQPDVAGAHLTLATYGKTFKLASLFMPRVVVDDAAVVYRFCRSVDDTVDESATESQAIEGVLQTRLGLRGLDTGTVCVQAYLAVAQRLDIPNAAAEALISGVHSDLGLVRIKSMRELGCYAYRVAGAVGQMMVGVLRVHSPKAMDFAVELGMAMQITNICRDVMEDAQSNRVYLPSDVLKRHGTSAQEILTGTAPAEKIGAVVNELLSAAELLYDRAFAGLRFIPWRSRVGICAALHLYRAIGRKLQRRHTSNPFHGRTTLTQFEKAYACVAALADFASTLWARRSIESLPDSPFGCRWETLAAPCRLDEQALSMDLTVAGSYVDVAS